MDLRLCSKTGSEILDSFEDTRYFYNVKLIQGREEFKMVLNHSMIEFSVGDPY